MVTNSKMSAHTVLEILARIQGTSVAALVKKAEESQEQLSVIRARELSEQGLTPLDVFNKLKVENRITDDLRNMLDNMLLDYIGDEHKTAPKTVSVPDGDSSVEMAIIPPKSKIGSALPKRGYTKIYIPKAGEVMLEINRWIKVREFAAELNRKLGHEIPFKQAQTTLRKMYAMGEVEREGRTRGTRYRAVAFATPTQAQIDLVDKAR